LNTFPRKNLEIFIMTVFTNAQWASAKNIIDIQP